MVSDEPVTGRQQELLEFLFKCESIAQDVVTTAPNNALMEHAVDLCEGYLKTMLDLHQVWQRLQQTQAQESDIGAQLQKMHVVLQDVARQAERNGVNHTQARYWLSIGKLIEEVLRLSQQAPQPVIPISPETTPVQPPEKGAAECDCEPAGDNALQLTVHLFGEFNASLNGRSISRWSKGKGQKIFKYLLLHRTTPVPKERLMEIFWPDADARAARNNLNVSLYYLRQNLSRYHKTFPFVLYRDGCYFLNTELSIWLDVEMFDRYIRQAQQHRARHEIAEAIAGYRCAEALYQGDCLLDENGDEWALLLSQSYRMKYLNILEYLGDRLLENGDSQECVSLWQKALGLDNCNEEAHQRIMYCYLQMGQRQMALRQYQLCETALQKDLGLKPSAATRQLLEEIRADE